MVGDFNCVRRVEESVGNDDGVNVGGLGEKFNNSIEHTKAKDLPLVGRKFIYYI